MTSRAFAVITVGLMALVPAACTPDSEPVGPKSSGLRNSAQVSDTTHYYLYLGEPMYLVPETQRFVVSVENDNLLNVVRDALRPFGLGATEERSLFQPPNHSVINIDGASAGVDVLGAFRADARIAFAAPMYRLAADGQEIVLINQFDVQFREGTPSDAADEIIRSVGGIVLRRPARDSGFFAYRVKYAAGVDPLQVARDLERGNAAVEWVSADMISAFRPLYVPTDPYYGQQYFLKNSITKGGVNVDINIEPAWDLTLGSNNIRISVIDDGIDVMHGNTGGDLTAGQFNGSHGYDTFWPSAPPNENAFYPCCNDVHGTAIAGMIWASHNNGVGIAGIAPNSKMVAARIFRRTLPPEAVTPPYTQVASANLIADAINWSWSFVVGSAIINNSWGGGAPNSAITTSINNALTMGRGGSGAVVVFAAGNTSVRSLGFIGPVWYPATLAATTNAISVGSIDRFGNPADYTPNGTITVVAPSGAYTDYCLDGDVVTLDRRGTPGCNNGPGGNIDFTSTFSGTSASAPQVAGVAALMLTRYPGLTAGQVKTRIVNSANNWGPATTFGAGKLNAYGAIF